MTGRLRPGVLLDVDGTLVDTNYLHALAWSRALRSAGEWSPMNAIHRLVGMRAGRCRVGELLDQFWTSPLAFLALNASREPARRAED